MIFKTAKESHAHSLLTLEQLNNHYEFKISIDSILDIGCGVDLLDLKYWANMEDELSTRTSGTPLNINCVGLDKVSIEQPEEKNIKIIKHDFNTENALGDLHNNFDVVWCHDVMQYSLSPISFLNNCNSAMADGGMLYVSVPTTFNVMHNKFENYTLSGSYNTFSITQIIYLLALNGFDIKDFHIRKEPYVDIIELITYKISEPLDYNTSWYDLMEQKLLNNNMEEIVFNKGYLTNIGLVTTWIDGNVYDYRYEN